ncbi:hypothetical protein BGZ98_000759, partial [Dissophora globulifera]
MAQPNHQAQSPATTIAVIGVDDNILTTATVATPQKRDINALRKYLRPMMLYVVSAAQFLDIVNGASVAVAVIPIAEDLNFSVPLMTWILNA